VAARDSSMLASSLLIQPQARRFAGDRVVLVGQHGALGRPGNDGLDSRPAARAPLLRRTVLTLASDGRELYAVVLVPAMSVAAVGGLKAVPVHVERRIAIAAAALFLLPAAALFAFWALAMRTPALTAMLPSDIAMPEMVAPSPAAMVLYAVVAAHACHDAGAAASPGARRTAVSGCCGGRAALGLAHAALGRPPGRVEGLSRGRPVAGRASSQDGLQWQARGSVKESAHCWITTSACACGARRTRRRRPTSATRCSCSRRQASRQRCVPPWRLPVDGRPQRTGQLGVPPVPEIPW
jgi:hypothetical protein